MLTVYLVAGQRRTAAATPDAAAWKRLTVFGSQQDERKEAKKKDRKKQTNKQRNKEIRNTSEENQRENKERKRKEQKDEKKETKEERTGGRNYQKLNGEGILDE